MQTNCLQQLSINPLQSASWETRSLLRKTSIPPLTYLTMSSSPKIHRPKPRRPYETSTPQSPPSPLLSPSAIDDTPSRTHSILNLTSSTLLGIYSQTGNQFDLQSDLPSTPSSPPASVRRRLSTLPPVHKPTPVETAWRLGLRGILLFGMGMGYGLLVRHLHDDRQLAPFQVEGLIKPRNDAGYLLFWGVAGVALGSLLPWVDTLFAVPELDTPVFEQKKEEESDAEAGIFGADWTPVVRSVGAFVGIAYAIVNIPPSILLLFSSRNTVLMFNVEKTPLDVDSASLSNPRTRQSRPLVPGRPLETRLHPLHRRRRNWHRSPPRLEPRYDALSRLHRKFNNEIPAYSQGRRLARLCGARKCRRRGMDSLSAILQLCVFREYWTEVGAQWRE
jgi:hypothetical protein